MTTDAELVSVSVRVKPVLEAVKAREMAPVPPLTVRSLKVWTPPTLVGVPPESAREPEVAVELETAAATV
jgi:hypothetical protein